MKKYLPLILVIFFVIPFSAIGAPSSSSSAATPKPPANTPTVNPSPTTAQTKSPTKTPTPKPDRCGVTADGAPFCGADGNGKACSTLTDCFPRCKISADGKSAQCAEDGTGKTCFDPSECQETACQQSADGTSGKCVVGGRGARCNPAKEGATGDVCKDKRCSSDGQCVFGGYGKPCTGVAGECPKKTCAYLPDPDGKMSVTCADGSKSGLKCETKDQPDNPDFKGNCPDKPKVCVSTLDASGKVSGNAQCVEKPTTLPPNSVEGSACSTTADCKFNVCQDGKCVEGGRVGWKGGVTCDPAVDKPGRCGEKRCNGYSCSTSGQGMRCDGEGDCSYNACMPGYFYKRGGAGGAPPGCPTPDPEKPEDQDKLFCIIVEGNAPDQCSAAKPCPQPSPGAPTSFDENTKAAYMWSQRHEDYAPLQTKEEMRQSKEALSNYISSIPTDRIKGSSSAPILLVMFQDLKCGMCKSSFNSLLPEIEKDYVDTGKVRLVLLDYPLGLRETESRFAQATRCAEEQGAYHQFISVLYNNMKDSSSEKLSTYASELKLDSDKFMQCLDSKKYRSQVEQEFNLGSKLGVNGTPTFFINGKRADGALSYEAMSALINDALVENHS